MEQRTTGASTWVWGTVIWGGIALFDSSQTVFGMKAEGMHHAWGLLFIRMMLSWLPWALVTPWVVALGRRYPVMQLRPALNWVRHLGACLAIGLLTSLFITFLDRAINPWLSVDNRPFSVAWFYKFVGNLLAYVVLYAGILLTTYVLDARERVARQQAETARLSEQLSRAQLNALRRQIEPHFLFNALNAIAGLVREHRNDDAVATIAGLSDFLRRVINEANRQEVPLADEMEFAQKYLDIQKVRFAERLQVSVHVPDDLMEAQVPALLLQPIVENAVKHGISKRVHGGSVRIAASRTNGTLRLSVYNDGPRLPDECEQCDSGVGLANVRTRLQSLYGEQFELKIQNQGPDGVETCVSLPFRRS